MAERERGATLVETLVVLSITAMLAVPLLGLLRTSGRVEQGQNGRIEARSQLDWALTLISSDIRNATPSADMVRGAEMGRALPLSVRDSGGFDVLLDWSIGAAGLERVVFDPVSLRETGRSVVVGEVMAPSNTSPFVYLDANGQVLDPRVLGAGPVANCTALITVTLVVDAGDRLVTSSADVALRTRPPGGNGC